MRREVSMEGTVAAGSEALGMVVVVGGRGGGGGGRLRGGILSES